MSDPDGNPAGRTPQGAPYRGPSPAETLEAIGSGDDETTTCRELAAFVCRTLGDAAAVDLTVEGRTRRVAAGGGPGARRPPRPPPGPPRAGPPRRAGSGAPRAPATPPGPPAPRG
ncbi:hypothetical protein ACFVG7_20405, partial [Streptomyces sp. NPDC127112]